MDPIHQFQIKNLLTFGHIGGAEIAFTNSAATGTLRIATDHINNPNAMTAADIGRHAARSSSPRRHHIDERKAKGRWIENRRGKAVA